MEMSQLPQSEKINLNIYVHEAFPKVFNKDRRLSCWCILIYKARKHLEMWFSYIIEL